MTQPGFMMCTWYNSDKCMEPDWVPATACFLETGIPVMQTYYRSASMGKAYAGSKPELPIGPI